MPEEYIIDKHLSVDEQLISAILSNNSKRVRQCLESGANSNYKTGTKEAPLVAARSSHQHKIVALLLEHGAQVDMVMDDQKVLISPLHWAAFYARIDSHEALDHMLTYDKNKAFRYLKDGKGRTPYDYIQDKALKAHYDELLAAEIEATPSANTSSWPMSFSRFFRTSADPANGRSSNAIELNSIGQTKLKRE